MLYHLSFFKRNKGKYDAPIFIDSTDCEIEYDAISNSQSNFKTGVEKITASIGDFVLVKEFISGKFIYFGVIQSKEKQEFGACQIFSLLDFDFVATRISGKSFENHFKTLVINNLINDETKDIPHLVIYVRTNTEHLYQPSNPPTVTNLMKYYFNAFKKYNIVWRFVEIDTEGNLITELIRIESHLKIKDNISDFSEWDVNVRTANTDNENKLLIVNKKTTSSESPLILATYFLTKNNELTIDSNHQNIERPTATKVYIYDTEQEDRPTFENVAKSELSGNAYSHEITFDVRRDSSVLKEKDIFLGLLVRLTIDGQQFDSVLSYFKREESFIELKFGNIRSRLTEYIDD
ncbi:MAG: hypothetical protein ACTIC2_08985 [Enterococcus devriesei]|uniref:hypothetical protein n=1 Tax=Enterococcus devriesei TaxID=319970 RepID=UPI003F8EB846